MFFFSLREIIFGIFGLKKKFCSFYFDSSRLWSCAVCVAVIGIFSVLPVFPLLLQIWSPPSPLSRSTSLMLLSGWVGWLQGSFGGETNAHVVLCWWGRLLYRSEIQHSFSFYVFHSVRQTGRQAGFKFFFDFSFFHRPLFMFCSASLSFCPVGLSVQLWVFYLCQLFLGDGGGWRLRLPSTSLFPYRPVFILIIQIILH